MRMLQPGSGAAPAVAGADAADRAAGLGPNARRKIGKSGDCGAGGPTGGVVEGGFLACDCAWGAPAVCACDASDSAANQAVSSVNRQTRAKEGLRENPG